MRRFALSSIVVVVALSGCRTGSCHTSTGWGMWIGEPSSVETTVSTLVQQGPGPVTAQALGGFAGPINSGAMQAGSGHSAAVSSVGVAPIVIAAPPPTQSFRSPGDQKMTCEEWCARIRAMQTAPGPQPMPMGPAREE